VERIFPVHSPRVAGIEVIRKGKVRRAKLYYLRERVGKSAKVKTNWSKIVKNKGDLQVPLFRNSKCLA